MQTAKAMQQALIAEEADEEDDDDEEDDSDDDDDDDEEEDSDDEVDEEAAKVQMGIAHLKKALTSEPLNGKEFSDMEDDDMEVRSTEAPAGYTQSSCSSSPLLYACPSAASKHTASVLEWDAGL